MFETGNRAERNLHQACMIPVGDKWWSVIFQDRDGGMIGFHDLEFPLNINSLTFRVRNHDAHNVMLEAKDNATGHVLGKVALPESADDYIDVNMPLIEALPSGTRLEFRVWNCDWNQPSMGRVDIDAITFND